MKTSELLESIRNRIMLSPASEYYLKRYLRSLDGVTLDNDLEEDEE